MTEEQTSALRRGAEAIEDGLSFLVHTGNGEPDLADIDPQHAAGFQRARRKDETWFAQRPWRTYRLRRPTEAERRFFRAAPSQQGYPAIMLVAQVRPGFRQRCVVYTRLDSQTPEPVIEAYAKLLRSATETGYVGELGAEDMRAAMGLAGTETRH